MRKFLSLLALLLASQLAHAEVIDIDNAELTKLLGNGVTLIDIRTPMEWEQTGIVAGSQLLTFFDERGRANPESWLERARKMVKAGQPVAVICRTGNRTQAVSQFLNQQGFASKIYNVRHGIMAWGREGRPVVSATQAMAACRAAHNC